MAYCPARISFHIPPASTPATDAAEPTGLIAAQVDSPMRPAPRSLAVTRALTDPNLPAIRFSGRWLLRLGFMPGCRAAVTAEAGRIVLTLDTLDRTSRDPAGLSAKKDIR